MRLPRFLTVLALGASLAAGAAAPTEPQHPWVVPAPRLAKQAYFSNLQDGASIETPFVLKFGLTGIGLAPNRRELAHTGHHHLLINRELPMDFAQPLPFNEQYRHFGNGQMETVLDFAPGKYTLRLVMADYRHVPNFVYSKPLTVNVTKKNAGVEPQSLVRKGVAVLAPQPGAAVTTPFRIAFHVSGYNVSHAALDEPGSGHFRLRLKREGGREEAIELRNGHTEIWLKAPAGSYTARVEFLDNTAADKVLESSESLSFRVDR